MSVGMQPKPPPPRPAPPPSGGLIGSTSSKKFAISSGRAIDAQRIGLFGGGGVGKSKLASLLKNVGIRPLILDVENGTKFLDVERIGDIEKWGDLRGILHDKEMLAPFDAIVIDSMTKAEEMSVAHTLANVPAAKGKVAERLEDYGYGKGPIHCYETFLKILGDLDAVVRMGKHVIVICHDCKAKVPNPAGEYYIRYEHRLPETEKAPTRSKVFEWCDHFFFIGYDVSVEDGKAQGSGTRAIYCTETATHRAKSRDLADPIVYADGSSLLWEVLFKKGS
jgi:hypothetical protein